MLVSTRALYVVSAFFFVLAGFWLAVIAVR